MISYYASYPKEVPTHPSPGRIAVVGHGLRDLSLKSLLTGSIAHYNKFQNIHVKDRDENFTRNLLTQLNTTLQIERKLRVVSIWKI
jgi:hypothetical protein